MTFDVIVCANWLTASLHQIGATVHVPVTQAIDAALAVNPNLDLLGPYTADNADVEATCVKKTIYLPAPFVRIFLELNLKHVEAWSFLWGAIINDGSTVGFRLIVYWLQVALTNKSGEYQLYSLDMYQLTASITDGVFMCHCHQVLIHRLPGINPMLKRVQGLLLPMHIEEVTVEIQ